jgi:hypothetical protein
MRSPALAAASLTLVVLLLASLVFALLASAFDDLRVVATLLTLPFQFLGRGEGQASAFERGRLPLSPPPGFAASPSRPHLPSREPESVPAVPGTLRVPFLETAREA